MKMIKICFSILISFGLTSGLMAQDDSGDFGLWDEDQDGLLNNDEFETGYGEEGIFEEYDDDSDGIWSDEEYTAAQEENDFLQDEYSNWDLDNNGFVYEDEFYERSYDTWDENDDSWLDENEYDNNYSTWSK